MSLSLLGTSFVSRDTGTQIFLHASKWCILRAHSSLSDGGCYNTLHNLNGSRRYLPMRTKTTKHSLLHGHINPNLMGMSPNRVRIFENYKNKSLIRCKSGLDSTLRSCAMDAWISSILVTYRRNGLDGCVDTWTPEIHTPWRIGRSQMVLCTALLLYDNCITPVIITDITGRRNVRIQNKAIIYL